MAQHAQDTYYVPHGSKWPIVGSLGMITMLASAANFHAFRLVWHGDP